MITKPRKEKPFEKNSLQKDIEYSISSLESVLRIIETQCIDMKFENIGFFLETVEDISHQICKKVEKLISEKDTHSKN